MNFQVCRGVCQDDNTSCLLIEGAQVLSFLVDLLSFAQCICLHVHHLKLGDTST